jgi:uncharacterized RDD family membrane protein YckC
VTGRPLAEWWRRLLAYLLDGLIVGLPGYVVYQVVFVTRIATINLPRSCQGQHPSNSCGTQFLHAFLGPLLITVLAYLAVQFAFGALYFTLFVGSARGQTIGMMALHIAVRDERDDVTIGRRRALARWLVFFALSIPFGILAFIDCLAPLWDRRRQAWHDHAARSLVVDAD